MGAPLKVQISNQRKICLRLSNTKRSKVLRSPRPPPADYSHIYHNLIQSCPIESFAMLSCPMLSIYLSVQYVYIYVYVYIDTYIIYDKCNFLSITISISTCSPRVLTPRTTWQRVRSYQRSWLLQRRKYLRLPWWKIVAIRIWGKTHQWSRDDRYMLITFMNGYVIGIEW